MVARLALVTMVLVGTQALAGTEHEKFENQIKKYAAVSGPSKTVCACQNGLPNMDGRYGWVRYNATSLAFGHFCSVPAFNADGSVQVERACFIWVPLAK
jgi:hypothetical protein